MSGFQRGGEEAVVSVYGQPVRLGLWMLGVEGRRQRLRALAQVLTIAGVQFRALGELETHPLTVVGLPHRGVLFTRLRSGPLNGPVLLGLVTAGSCGHTVSVVHVKMKNKVIINMYSVRKGMLEQRRGRKETRQKKRDDKGWQEKR